ncbi:MAG: hypothetical protein RL497_2334 [Pseudomonadota bacterium]
MSDLAQQQRQFLAYMRNPSGPLPEGANPRAMNIYADLVYRNIAGFLNQAFPVCTQVCEEHAWEALIRTFIAQNPSQTPYFLGIAEEFVQFLLSHPASLAELPAYITELAHYEWVELALDITDIPQPPGATQAANPWHTHWQLSPLAWCLAYQYPVHLIGPNNPNPAPNPSAFVVYRNRAQEVKFIALTPACALWLQTITPQTTPHQALNQTLNSPLTPEIEAQTRALLTNWIELGILVPVEVCGYI